MLQHLGRISPIVVMILVCRELTITGLRALASAEGVIVSASAGGKWKTALQMTAIPCLMLKEGLGIPFLAMGMWLTYLSLAFSLWSAKDYLVGFFKGLQVATALRKERRLQKKIARQRKREARLKSVLERGAGSK
jgi:CDP-diacylglycerol--glycerol-3-phosphate 3-phosphatidyltransferase